MKAVESEPLLITCIWHPTIHGNGGFHDLGNGVNARTLKGDPAYQVTSGEIVAL